MLVLFNFTSISNRVVCVRERENIGAWFRSPLPLTFLATYSYATACPCGYGWERLYFNICKIKAKRTINEMIQSDQIMHEDTFFSRMTINELEHEEVDIIITIFTHFNLKFQCNITMVLCIKLNINTTICNLFLVV